MKTIERKIIGISISIWLILVSIAFVGFTYLKAMEYISSGFSDVINRDNNTDHFGLILLTTVSYLLIGIAIYYLVKKAIHVESYEDKNVTWGIIIGLIWGVIIGSLLGVVSGIIWSYLVVHTIAYIVSLVWIIKSGIILGIIGSIVTGATVFFVRNIE